MRDLPRDKVRKILQEIGGTHPPGMANLTQKVLPRSLCATGSIPAGAMTIQSPELKPID